MKFSGSEEKNGYININIIIIGSIIIIPKISFLEKNGWKLILSLFIVIEIGFEEPFLWRNARWTRDINDIRNGMIKWIE